MTSPEETDSWYPSNYWVPKNVADQRPLRYGELVKLTRIAALDHDARVGLIRREIYFKYRWFLSWNEVRDAEAARISNDSTFTGPKPDWAEN